MAKPSNLQQETVERVMHEFKHGELETHGRKVRRRRQAVAIALSEAGVARDQTPASRRSNAGQGSTRGGGATKESLYDEARRRGIAGRSRMSKAELERALHH